MGPWALPTGWEWRRLGELGQFINGAAFKPTDWSDSGRPIIRIQNLNDPLKKMNRTLRIVDDRYIVEAGDLLVSWSATLDVFTWHGESAWLNQHIFKVIPDESVVDRRFLYYLLIHEIEALKKSEHLHGSTMMHINRGPFLAHAVPLPPPDVQQQLVARIEDLMNELDDAGEALERTNHDFGIWRKALLRAAMTGELTASWRSANPTREPDSDPIRSIAIERRGRWAANPRRSGKQYREPRGANRAGLKDLPPGWVWTTVEQLAFVENGQTPKGIDSVVSEAGEIPWFKVSSMNIIGNDEFLNESRWRISADDARKIGLHVHERGTIVFPKRGGSIFTEKKRRLGCDAAFDLNVMGVTPLASTARYLWTFFQNLSLASISDGSNVPQINYDDVAQLTLGLPPPAERDRICDLIEDLISCANEVEQEVSVFLSYAVALRQSILATAFRGDLVQ
ncbi:restriction endonuclease subunit S [Sphingomonas sp. AR_OL41]|uniref:restriction endonuclease subunit S n=1 Tax=Sphingomonas sp. AR_OL41 TaxID=3042729 RepID=UPI00247FD450|nr:restriction endonuclease subunit S [Sphingomonas sp. AR_OL41]MDH7974095.1 restriction endonuclease subunit S [Sphingomonas sp. AR_OL41]